VIVADLLTKLFLRGGEVLVVAMMMMRNGWSILFGFFLGFLLFSTRV